MLVGIWTSVGACIAFERFSRISKNLALGVTTGYLFPVTFFRRWSTLYLGRCHFRLYLISTINSTRAMNWTGGALPRSRKGNSKATSIAQQKKYFAKARGRILSGRRSSPGIDFSTLDHAKNANERPKNRSPSTINDTPGNRSQTRLEAYEQTAPVVRQLSSLRARHNEGNPRSPKARGVRERFHSQSFGEPASSEDHLFYGKAKLDKSFSGQENKTGEPIQAGTVEDTFEAKKRAILQNEDWVGLSNTKPAKIKFADAKDRELIGRRRRIETQDMHDRPRKRIEHDPFNHFARRSPSLEDISIRIGSQDHASGRRRTIPTYHDPLSGSIEEMLFDIDCAGIAPTKGYIDGNTRIHNQSTRHSSTSLQRPLQECPRNSISRETSWAGFSAWSGDIDKNGSEGDASDLREEEGSAHNLGPGHQEDSKNQGPSPLLRDTAAVTNQMLWAEVPGLPLLFEDSPKQPIEISSDSEESSDMPSHDNHTFDVTDLLTERRADVAEPGRLEEHKRDLADISRSYPPSAMTRKPTFHPLSPQRGVSDASREPANANAEQRAAGKAKVELRPNTHVHTMVAKLPGSPERAQPPVEPPIEELATDAQYLLDEELIWRNFVFGSDKPHAELEPAKSSRKWDLMSDTPMLTESSEYAGQSSLSVQASSGGLAISQEQSEPASSEGASLRVEAATSIPPTHSEITIGSSELETSPLPLQNHRGLNPQLSVVAHASSSSPTRPGRIATSPSTDELARTPRRPKFVFTKPSRYVSSEPDTPVTVRLGQSRRSSRRQRFQATGAMRGEIETDERLEGNSEEDEIVDM